MQLSISDLAICRPSVNTMLSSMARMILNRPSYEVVCWTLEKVGDVFWTREVLVLRNTSTPDQQAALAHRIARARRVCFDYTGPGIGLGDYLVKDHGEYDPAAHKFGKLELCTFTIGFKRDIFPKLRRAFEAPVRLRVPVDVEVREDLHEMQQTVKNGEYTYSTRRTAEGHSDRCTALARRAASAPASTGAQSVAAVGAHPDDDETGNARTRGMFQ